MLLSIPNTATPRYAPAIAIGSERMTATGIDQLSYWAARKRNTNSNASASTRPVCPLSFFS